MVDDDVANLQVSESDDLGTKCIGLRPSSTRKIEFHIAIVRNNMANHIDLPNLFLAALNEIILPPLQLVCNSGQKSFFIFLIRSNPIFAME